MVQSCGIKFLYICMLQTFRHLVLPGVSKLEKYEHIYNTLLQSNFHSKNCGYVIYEKWHDLTWSYEKRDMSRE
jgi:hypothetical protein